MSINPAIAHNKAPRRRIFPTLYAIALCFVSPYGAAQSSGVQPGLWEIRLRTEYAGASHTLPATVLRQCITPDQTQDPRQLLPRAVSGTECKVRDYTLEGGRATWNIVCTGDPIINGTGSLEMSARRYSGTSRLEMHKGNETMVLTQVYDAQYLGPCEASTGK